MSALKNDVVEPLIDRILTGDRRALEDLFGRIQRFVMRATLRELGPFSRDLDCKAEVLARICSRFLTNDYKRLRAYKLREQRCFATFVRVVMRRVAIDLARGMRENVAPRTERQFRWVTKVEYFDADHPEAPDIDARVRLYDVLELLQQVAEPHDLEMLRRSVAGETWLEIAEHYGTTPNAARQRVRRLRALLRSWTEERSSAGC